jgi:uncharacterized membrane protein YfcA
MGGEISTLAFAVLTFVLGGFIKGGIGVGLPTIAMGLLTFVMTPAQAAALLIAPTFATNLWQAAAGHSTVALLRRLWPMFFGICVGTWLSTGLLTTGDGKGAITALGVVLALYAIYGLSAPQLSVPPRLEIWLGPLVGALSGAASAATGVFMLPSLPYLQALALDKDDFVQAIGLCILVSTTALAAMLARDGALPLAIAGASLAALVPALFGMWVGQLARARVSADAWADISRCARSSNGPPPPPTKSISCCWLAI